MKKQAEYKISSLGKYEQFWSNGHGGLNGKKIDYKGISYRNVEERHAKMMPIPSAATTSYGGLIVKSDTEPTWQLVKVKNVIRGQKLCFDINITQTDASYSDIKGYLSITIEENM